MWECKRFLIEKTSKIAISMVLTILVKEHIIYERQQRHI